MNNASKKSAFRGWWILALSTVAIALTGPGQTIGVSSFIDEITTDLRLTDTTVSTAYLVGTITGSLAMPAIGRWIDRRGVKFTMIIIATLFSAAVAHMGLVQNLTGLIFGFIGIRMLGQGALSLVSQTSIALWFDQRRGLAFGISMTISAGMMATAPILLTALIEAVGWRWAWAIAGSVVFILIVPATAIFMADRPETLGQHPDGRATSSADSGIQKPQYTVFEALHTSAFWVLTLVMVVSSLLITGLTFHHFALMTSSGLTTSQAAAIFIPQIAGTIGAGFIWASLSDKVSARFLLITCQLSLAAAHISYIWVSPGFTAALYSLLLGVNGGSIRALTSVLYPKWFGTANIGAIRGVATAFGVGASAMGPLVIAVGFNLTASYSQLNALLSIVPVGAMVTAAFIVAPNSRKERISSGPHR